MTVIKMSMSLVVFPYNGWADTGCDVEVKTEYKRKTKSKIKPRQEETKTEIESGERIWLVFIVWCVVCEKNNREQCHQWWRVFRNNI